MVVCKSDLWNLCHILCVFMPESEVQRSYSHHEDSKFQLNVTGSSEAVDEESVICDVHSGHILFAVYD